MVRLLGSIVAAIALLASSTDSRVLLTGGRFAYAVKPGDTLTSIGARFGVGVRTLTALNDLAHPDRLWPGQSLAIDNRHLAVLAPGYRLSINVAQRMLYVADEQGVTAYPIAAGRRDWKTPLGSFSVLAKETNPTWDVPDSIQREMRQRGEPVITQMLPSADNPLGAFWIGLSLPGLGIHGTNAPSSIYQLATHGCIRLHPDDVAALFPRIAIGDPGMLIYEPVLAVLVGDRVFLEVHEDTYHQFADMASVARQVAHDGGLEDRVDWARASRVLAQRFGIAVDVTRE